MHNLSSSHRPHDLEDRSESINIFSVKLHKTFKFLKTLIYFSWATNACDFILLFIFPKVFFKLINILSIFFVVLGLVFCLYTFKHNFEIVSYSVYKSAVRAFYSIWGVLVIYYFDMFYLWLFRIWLDFETMFTVVEKSFLEVFMGIVWFFIYFLVNLTCPVVIVFKVYQIKTTVKDWGRAQGEKYDEVSTVEVTDNINNNNNSGGRREDEDGKWKRGRSRWQGEGCDQWIK